MVFWGLSEATGATFVSSLLGIRQTCPLLKLESACVCVFGVCVCNGLKGSGIYPFSICHVDYFELKAIKNQLTQEKLFISPFTA